MHLVLFFAPNKKIHMEFLVKRAFNLGFLNKLPKSLVS